MKPVYNTQQHVTTMADTDNNPILFTDKRSTSTVGKLITARLQTFQFIVLFRSPALAKHYLAVQKSMCVCVLFHLNKSLLKTQTERAYPLSLIHI